MGGWWSGKRERLLVLFKGGGCRVSPKFHLFVFYVNQGNKEDGTAIGIASGVKIRAGS